MLANQNSRFLSLSFTLSIALAGSVLLTTGCESGGGGRHERHQEALTESATVGSVAGGDSFQSTAPFDQTYESVTAFLQKQDWLIESGSKDTGQIVTAYHITGAWRQTGTRVIITLIKNSDATVTVKTAVTEQHRYKALQTEPWDDAKVNAAKSSELGQQIKAAL